MGGLLDRLDGLGAVQAIFIATSCDDVLKFSHALPIKKPAPCALWRNRVKGIDGCYRFCLGFCEASRRVTIVPGAYLSAGSLGWLCNRSVHHGNFIRRYW